MTDNHRNGRIRLFNLQPVLKPGENLIVVSADSHTDKAMTDTERKQYPQSLKHINARPGFAFYARYTAEGKETELVSDTSWRVRRAPLGDWGGWNLDEREWASATLLPAGVTPVDEGPGLEPLRRKDFANLPVELGPALRPAASTAALAGKMRAAFVAADPLALALDRPNREQVITSRLSAATTIQALELTNGSTLDSRIQEAAGRLAPEASANILAWSERLFRHALGRLPTTNEQALVQEIFTEAVSPETVGDVLWAVTMLPEFQLLN